MLVGDSAGVGLQWRVAAVLPDVDADIHTYADEHAYADEYPNTHVHSDKHAHSDEHANSDEHTDTDEHTYARASACACWLGNALCQQFLFGPSRPVRGH
jgi:hypothetical protein